MSPFYAKNQKLLVIDNKLSIDQNCCCPESWLRSHIRIGGNNTHEQGWLVTLGQPPAAPYTDGQIPNQNRNAEWYPNKIINADSAIMHPPITQTQTFNIAYDKVARNIRFSLSGADTTGRNPPWPSVESIAVVPQNKLTSETVLYKTNLELYARGRIFTWNNISNSTLSTGMKIFGCSIAVIGEPVVAIPDTEVLWLNPTNITDSRILPPQVSAVRELRYKLGKGFTITGSVTITWEGIRPAQSQVQGWFRLFDFTNDYII